MIVKRYEERFLAALASLEETCFSKPWSEQALADFFAYECNGALVAVEKDDLLGYVTYSFTPDECVVANVAVSPHHRRLGIGKALLQTLETEARANGKRVMYLEVRVSNTPAVTLYEKAGFTVAGRRKNFYSQPREDAFVMTKDLPEADHLF